MSNQYHVHFFALHKATHTPQLSEFGSILYFSNFGVFRFVFVHSTTETGDHCLWTDWDYPVINRSESETQVKYERNVVDALRLRHKLTKLEVANGNENKNIKNSQNNNDVTIIWWKKTKRNKMYLFRIFSCFHKHTQPQLVCKCNAWYMDIIITKPPVNLLILYLIHQQRCVAVNSCVNHIDKPFFLPKNWKM